MKEEASVSAAGRVCGSGIDNIVEEAVGRKVRITTMGASFRNLIGNR